jgi:hypothetical protein
MQVVAGDTNKRWALRYSIYHHLKLSEDNKKKGMLFIHCHPFSVLGWGKSKKDYST